MSHQSGIRTSQELADLFVTAVAGGNLRVIRVSIVSESLIPDGTAEVSGSWETDFSKIQDFLEEKKPAYIIYRLDTKSSAGDYEWLFLAYVPDNAKVRDKMLYASTRATLTKELGDYRFVDSMYGSTTEEFTLEGYRKHLQHQKADAPLTEREKELNEVRAAEASTNVYSSSARRSHAAGVSFPTANDAIQALKNLGQTY
ncbi:2366_t:CDS:2, partial [Paraglomus occultum]